MYENLFLLANDFVLFAKADDDTYVIVENLRYMLQTYDPQDPIWFGCKYSPYVERGYMSGGAGYVLSKAAVERFVNLALNESNSQNCRTNDDAGAEDVEMGKCLQSVNVTAGDSRDEKMRPRFFALTPDSMIVPGVKDMDFWYWKNQFYPADDGDNCCSETTIAFHYIDPHQMYVLDFFAYRLKVFGIK